MRKQLGIKKKIVTYRHTNLLTDTASCVSAIKRTCEPWGGGACINFGRASLLRVVSIEAVAFIIKLKEN